MSTITDYIRPYWLKNINEVEGNVIKGLSGWLVDRKYQVYDQLEQDSAVLAVDNYLPLVYAYAADSKKMSSASFETINGVCPEVNLSKSSAWAVIRSYYAAFFAAHALLRLFGVSCSQIEASQANAINTVADLYGKRNGITFTKGLYQLQYNTARSSLILKKLDSGDGPHVSMWKIFHDKYHQISTDTLMRWGSSTATQTVYLKLADLCQALTNFSTLNKGDWLSQIRNRTNYRQDFGVWFPYENRADHCDVLCSRTQLWLQDPMTINIWGKGRDLQRFIETCTFIVAMCRVVCIDMEERCTEGKSFQTLGPLRLLRYLSVL